MYEDLKFSNNIALCHDYCPMDVPLTFMTSGFCKYKQIKLVQYCACTYFFYSFRRGTD